MQKEKKRGLVFNIQRHCTEDGPGIRTTVFLKGCVMHCPWCQNPEGIRPFPELWWYEIRCIRDKRCIKVCPKEALSLTEKGMRIDREKCDACGKCVEVCPAGALEVIGKYYTVDELIPLLLRDKAFYDKSKGGITLSGGEPAMQPSFSIALLKELKKLGIHTAIETSLGVSWKFLKPLVEVSDLVILDIKLMNEKKHLEYLGVNLEKVLSNALKIVEMNKPIWVRTPIIPRYTDDEENIRSIANFIRNNLPTIERYELLAFNKACVKKYERLGLKWCLENEDLVNETRMEELVEIAKKQGVANAYWSGVAKRRSFSASETPSS